MTGCGLYTYYITSQQPHQPALQSALMMSWTQGKIVKTRSCFASFMRQLLTNVNNQLKIACSRLLTSSPGFLAPVEVSANKKKHPDNKKNTFSHGQESEHSLYDKPWHHPLPPESLLLMVGWQLLHQKKPIGKSQGISSAELDTDSSHQLLPFVLHFGEEFTWKSTLKSLKGFRFQGIKS